MTPPTPPALHAQTLEKRIALYLAWQDSPEWVPCPRGPASGHDPECVDCGGPGEVPSEPGTWSPNDLLTEAMAALRAREDAPDGTRAALRDVAIVVRDLAASEWADVAILPEWLRDLMRGRFGSTDGIAWPTITWRQLAAALAASPAPARSLADQLDDDYCSPAPSDDGGPR